MKNEDKKVPDAPDTLYVCPFHTGLTSGLLDEDGNPHGGYHVWHGIAVRASADDVLYINISKVWHSGKEHPINSEEECLLDFGDFSYEVGHIMKDSNESYIWNTGWGCFTLEKIVQWAYLKDIVPDLIEKKRGG